MGSDHEKKLEVENLMTSQEIVSKIALAFAKITAIS